MRRRPPGTRMGVRGCLLEKLTCKPSEWERASSSRGNSTCKGPRTGRVAGNWLGEEAGGSRQEATVDLREGSCYPEQWKFVEGFEEGAGWEAGL